MIKFIIATALTLSPLASAQAYDIKGIGGLSCAAWTQHYRHYPQATRDQTVDWAEGYMAALSRSLDVLQAAVNTVAVSNSITFGNTHNLQPDHIDKHIRQYCTIYPLANIFEAIEVLYNSLPQTAE